MIAWLKGSDKAGDDSQAMIIAQAMLDARYVICLTDNSVSFHTYDALYQFRDLTIDERKHLQENIEKASNYVHEEQKWDQSGLHGMSMKYKYVYGTLEDESISGGEIIAFPHTIKLK